MELITNGVVIDDALNRSELKSATRIRNGSERFVEQIITVGIDILTLCYLQ